MPPKLVGIIGDTHAGSKTAVSKRWRLDDGDEHVPSLHQAWLMDNLSDWIRHTLYQAQDHEFVLCLGGDLVDGVQHHGSTQTFGTPKDQTNLAVDLLRPLANAAAKIYALRGTDAHAGQSGNFDRDVAEELGVKAENIDFRHLIDFDGALLDWAHHVGAGRRPGVRGNSLKNLITDIYFTCLETRKRIPDLIVRHHVHQYDDVSDHRRGMRAVTVPGWQLHTTHTRRLSPHGLPGIGAMLWWPDKMKIEVKEYEPAADPIKYA